MRNNLQNDVKVENSTEFSSKLNLSGSISSTASMGKVNVKFMRRLLPKTKALCGEEQLVWLAPLVRPTFGKQFYKTWHYFVACKDAWAGWSSMKTGQPVSVNGQSITFTKEPHAQLKGLSAFALHGAKGTLYISECTREKPISLGIRENRQFVLQPPVNLSYRNLVQRILQRFWSSGSGGTNPEIEVGKLINGPAFWDGSKDLTVSSGNAQWESFTDLSNYTNIDAGARAIGFDYANVPMDTADAKVFFSFRDEQAEKDYICCIAFRFSSWGRWYSDLLRALGYGFNLSSTKEKSLLPLFAAFNSYWNTFGLNQFQNFETTYAGRLKSFWDVNDNFNPFLFQSMWMTFKNFIMVELGCMWVTEQADYVAAHLPQPVIGAKPDGYSGLVDIGGAGVPITDTDNRDRGYAQPTMVSRDGHAFINNVEHGALDSKLIMRLYKITNRNTALGRKIADLMRVAGLGFYAMYAKVNYIGETSIPLNVDKVVSQSDTFQPASGDGMALGDYAGRGIGYKPNDKKLYYYTEDEGFWICLDAVTCDSGYSQGVDQTLEHLTRADQFTPDFDGFGLVLHNKDLLVGSQDVCTAQLEQDILDAGDQVVLENIVRNSDEIAFGFAPIYSEYKVGRSILNGGFAAPSERKTYLPFVLDKLLFTDQLVVLSKDEQTTASLYLVGRSLPIDETPQAGTAWRYLSRFFWLSNLNRIFAYNAAQLPSSWQSFKDYASLFEYVYRVKDNYVLVSDLWFKAWSACLPIEETWGTLDEDKKELEYIERT